MAAFIIGMFVGGFIWHNRKMIIRVVDQCLEKVGIDLIDDKHHTETK